jgi:hypothetical protein
MATFEGKLKLNLDAVFGSSIDIGSLKHNIDYEKSFTINSGTGAAQANQVFVDQRTLSASTGEDLDLAGGLTDAFGSTITFTSIKGIIVYAASGNTNDVLVGGASSNQFIEWVSNGSDEVVVKPGGMFMLYNPEADGYTVTASTGDLLRFENSSSGTSVTYDLILIGEI